MKILTKLFPYLRPFLVPLAAALLLSVVVGAVATSPVPLIQKIFDQIFAARDKKMLTLLPLAIVGLYFVKAICAYLQDYLMYYVSGKLLISLRAELFRHIHRLPLSHFDGDSTGALMSRILYDVAAMQKAVTSVLRDVLINTVTLFGLLGWVFYYKWDWALISLLVFPVTGTAVSMIARHLRRLGRRGQPAGRQPPPGEGHVDAFGLKRLRQARRGLPLPPILQRRELRQAAAAKDREHQGSRIARIRIRAWRGSRADCARSPSRPCRSRIRTGPES